MTSPKLNRRSFLGAAASALSLASFPKLALAVTSPPVIRLDWEAFKLTPQYTSFLNAVRTMRANTDATSPKSWQYWANVHTNYCPHRLPYFLAWHRGYIYYFEQQLRVISGDSALTLPYWDYYTNANIPAEFTDTASGNPLYVPRLNTNVYSALDLSPFASTVVNFQRGTTDSFEEKIETAPHNPVHNIIGGVMATMQSPLDPIFYLHHANVDRLWHAWALPSGGTMPAPDSSYWSGSFTYALGLTMLKTQTYSPRSRLGYDYSDDARPTALPPQAQAARIIRVQAQVAQIRSRPPIVSFASTPARTIATGRRSLGGVAGVSLAEDSISARVLIRAADTEALQDALSASKVAYDAAAISPQAQARALASMPAGQYRSVKIVFDNVAVTPAGMNGGYFYNVYLNLSGDAGIDSSRAQHFLGTLGPFEVAGAMHQGSIMLDYPATVALLKMDTTNTREYVVSLVRVNGPTAPNGHVMRIGELRMELTTDAPFVPTQAAPVSFGDGY